MAEGRLRQLEEEVRLHVFRRHWDVLEVAELYVEQENGLWYTTDPLENFWWDHPSSEIWKEHRMNNSRKLEGLNEALIVAGANVSGESGTRSV